MRFFKRIISFVSAFAILFSLFVVPAGASGIDIDGVELLNWGQAYGRQLDHLVGSWFDSSKCGDPATPNGRHNFVEQHTSVDGKTGLFYICEYCGKSAGEVAPEAYEDFASSLPVNGYSSDGGLLWYPTVADILAGARLIYPHGSGGSYIQIVSSSCLPSFPYVYEGTNITNPSPRIFALYRSGSSYATMSSGFGTLFPFSVPLTAKYIMQSSVAVSGSYFTNSVGTVRVSTSYAEKDFGFILSGGGVKCESQLFPRPSSSGIQEIRLNFVLPYFRVIPDLEVDNSLYVPNTRMGNVTFDFGVTNGGDTITNVTNNYIVNEGDNTYTNPATGKSETITNWSYNYDDRSYDVTLEGGDTATVTYGDENVTITEYTTNDGGDVVTNNYTVYYVINNDSGEGGDVDPSPSPSPSPFQPDTPPSTLSRVFQNYGNKITQHYGHEGHNGVDVIPTSGVADTVIAHSEGEVVTIQTGQVNNTETTGAATWGNYVKIKHPNGMYTLYAHLANVVVKEGDYVTQGQPLGLMGDSGRAFGAHLHFEVYEDETTRIDPEPYLNADLPGLGSDDGWSWWKGAWSDFRSWLSGLFGNSDPETVFVPGVDSGADGEDSEWSFLDLLKAVVDGVWSFIKGIPGAIFGGFSGLIDGLFGIGDFFNSYKLDNPDGVFNILYKDGADIWD